VNESTSRLAEPAGPGQHTPHGSHYQPTTTLASSVQVLTSLSKFSSGRCSSPIQRCLVSSSAVPECCGRSIISINPLLSTTCCLPPNGRSTSQTLTSHRVSQWGSASEMKSPWLTEPASCNIPLRYTSQHCKLITYFQ